jgi:diguanylate cyclase (GGDEF)-like protein/PAS domain S-box-containing protein
MGDLSVHPLPTPRASAAAPDAATHDELVSDNAALRRRLAALEETLRAIRDGEVDGLFLAEAGGGRLFTLAGADRGYRALIEDMGEGALTVSPQGIVLYANRHFAALLDRPLGRVIGSRIHHCFRQADQGRVSGLLAGGGKAKRSVELELLGDGGVVIPVLLSVTRLEMDGVPEAICMVVTDLTAQREGEAAKLARQNLLDMIAEQARTEDNLRISMLKLRLHDSALGAISQGVLISDAQGRMTYANQGFETMTGFTQDEMLGRSCACLQGAGTSASTRQRMQDAIGAAQPFHGEILNYRKDGTPFWNALSFTPVFDKQGALAQFVGVQRDVTVRRETEAQLLLAAKLFEQGNEGVIITDPQRNIIKVNPAFTRISGFSEAEALGRNPRMLSSGRHDRAFHQAMWAAVDSASHWQGEIWNRRKDGSLYPQWLSLSRLVDAAGTTTHYIASFSDITLRKQAEESIRRLAYFDALTGLPNRALLGDRAAQALQLAQRQGEPMALMFLDLDHFKNVNDSLGHRVGDCLLVALAARFKAVLREQDTLARMGGDEFVLLLPNTDASGAAHVAGKLLQAATLPYHIEQHELTITPSIGIALYPPDGDDFDTLARCADAAMYSAKQDGRNTFHFHTAEIHAISVRALRLENGLRRALERGQMQLHYQPQRSLGDGRIVGAEALLRWQHPEFGWVSPAEFIPVAETSGLIASIGEWVLRTAMRQMRAWLDGGMAPLVMAVNLSAVQFRQPNLPELVQGILEDAGVAPACLELELTESVASENPVNAIGLMNRLHALGVRMSIDDFGTGYSSLNYLKRFKVYKLKIDQSFVSQLSDNLEDQAIVTAIISLARSLGMQTIAEGVETEAQMDFLRGKGCDEMQGYLLSRPLPAGSFRSFVDSYGSVPVPPP